MESWTVVRTQTIPRYFSTSSKDLSAVWTWECLSEPSEMVQSKGHHLSPSKRPTEPTFCELKSWQRAAGPSPLSLGSFLLSYLFQVPFCYLGWKFHTCSAQRNAAHAGQKACQEIGSNFSFVASCRLWLPLSHLWGRLCYGLSYSINLFQLGSKCLQATSSGGPRLTSVGSLAPDL